MSEFCDAEMADIIVVLDKRWEDNTAGALEQLKALGMRVDNVDEENNVVEGTVDAARLADIRKLDCVDYVRTTFTWIADYPPGDPRDQDHSIRPSE